MTRWHRVLAPTMAAALAVLTACGADAPTPDERGGAAAGDLETVAAATMRVEIEGAFRDFEFGGGIEEYVSGGTAFFIDPDGTAVTNSHVVNGAGLLRVYLNGESSPRSARVLGISECADLAVIQVDGEGFTSLDWYDGTVTPGLDIYAAGFPDDAYTLSRGIISKASFTVETEWASVDGAVEHDARTLPGNSGGPLVTGSGAVVGVNYAGTDIAVESLAIGGVTARAVVEALRRGDDVDSIGVNGIAFEDLDADVRGVWVSSVATGSPADRVGIEPGDIITRLQGLAVGRDSTMADYCDIIRSNAATDPIRVEVYRLDTEQVLEGTLNGDPLAEAFSLGAGARPGRPSQDAEFVAITDDSGRIYVEVPARWGDIDGRPFEDEAGNTIYDVIIAEDVQGFLDSWAFPGVRISASSDLARSTNEIDILENYYAGYSEDCVYDGAYVYEDAFYFGEYDLYLDCGGVADAIVLAVVPDNRAFVIWVQAVGRTDEDFAAIDRILDTFVFQ